MIRRPFVLALLACCLVAVPAGASNFWEQATVAKERAGDKAKQPKTFDELVAKAEEYTSAAEQYRRMWVDAIRAHSGSFQVDRFMDKARGAARDAIRYYDRALELRPDEADLHFVCGRLTYVYEYEYFEKHGPTSRRDKAGAHAVAHWDAFDRLAPDDPRRVSFIRESGPGWAQPGFFEPVTYQFARSIYYTKLGGTEGYEKAIEDYDFLLETAPRNDRTSRWVAQLLTNSAEIHMALGHVEEAIERYREGLDLSKEPLYMYGLAVALDRAGEKESALETMRDAIGYDPDMKALEKETVFFIPTGDAHYYYGLAFEAQGKSAKALQFYRLYVSEIEDDRYIEHARERIERLEQVKTRKK